MPNTGKRLTPKQRARIHELRAQQMSLQKIAQELDCAVFTVQWHLKRASERAVKAG